MQLCFLTPTPEPPGGGSRFNAGLIAALARRGHQVLRGGDAAALPPEARPIVDGMLLPALEPAMDRLLQQDAVVVVHHVAAATGQARTLRDAVQAVEARWLPQVRRVIATSAPVAARLVADYGLQDVPVLAPGIDDLPRSPGSGGPACRMLSVGVITPRKGHQRLVQALAGLTDLDWTLTIAGDAQRDPVHAQTVAALIDTTGLAGRVTLLPDPDDTVLEPAWRGADLFLLASSWEGYPAAVAEALRRGIPVVAEAAESVAAMVPQGAGIIAPKNDPVTFGKCLRRGIYDTALRHSLAEGAWTTGRALPGWPDQATLFETLLEG